MRHPEEAEKRAQIFTKSSRFYGPIVSQPLALLEDDAPVDFLQVFANKVIETYGKRKDQIKSILDKAKSEFLRDLIIFKLIKQANVEDDALFIQEIVSTFNYDQNFDPYARIVEENKNKLALILSKK